MKIWCVDHALTWNIHSDVYFTKEEAQERYDHYSSFKDAYVKMYQVEDIWHWCGRHFEKVVNEVIAFCDGISFPRGILKILSTSWLIFSSFISP